MKKIIIIVLLLWGTVAEAQIKSATLTASGLTCSMCSKSIYKSLIKVTSVAQVDANVEKSSFAITFKEGVRVSFDDIKKAVQDAGFSVASLQALVAFHNEQITNDTHAVIDGTTFHFINVTPQTLNGEKTVTVVDKNFLPAKDYKKYSTYTKMKCFATGMKEDCCPKNTGSSNRVYHVTI